MPNPFDPNSYGEPSFEDLMVGTLTESAARAKMEADELALAEQLRRQRDFAASAMGAPRPAARGSAGNPLVQNRASREADLRRRGYVGDPIDPNLMSGMTTEGGADAVMSYLGGVRGRVADDTSAAVHARVPGSEPPGRSLVTPPDVRSMNPDVGTDPRSPAHQIPLLGNVYDNRVMERRSQGRPGWEPADFGGLSHADAAALIAGQLKARRVKQLGEFSPDYIQSLPVY